MLTTNALGNNLLAKWDYCILNVNSYFEDPSFTKQPEF